MARAVVRQKNIPYALIVFVILFIISAVAAIFFYMHDDGKAARIDALDKDLKELRKDLDARTAELAELAGYISPEATFAKAQADYKAIMPNSPDAENPIGVDLSLTLIGNLRDFRRQIDEQTIRANTLAATMDDLESQLTSQLQDAVERRSMLETEVASLRTMMTDLTAAQQAERNSLAKQLADARQTHSDIQKELERQLSSQTQELARSANKIRQLEKDVEDLRIKLADLLQPDLAEGKKIYPDGNITSVPDEKTCYIDIGSDNGVMPDLIFSVYSPAGEQTAYKAKVIVKQVLPETSECVIAELVDPKNPISTGDIVANIAFDENRKWTFVVEGRFDLHGGDEPTSEGRDQVKALIRQFGGRIVDTVDVDVDFVVLGPEPTVPPAPEEDAPNIQWTIYNARMQEYEDYQAVKEQAIMLGLRILNTNRFLERIGYIPVKTLTYEESY